MEWVQIAAVQKKSDCMRWLQFSMNEIKNMQDKQGTFLSCSHCGRVIVTAARMKVFTEAQKAHAVHIHQCTKAQESKRDFEREVF